MSGVRFCLFWIFGNTWVHSSLLIFKMDTVVSNSYATTFFGLQDHSVLLILYKGKSPAEFGSALLSTDNVVLVPKSNNVSEARFVARGNVFY